MTGWIKINYHETHELIKPQVTATVIWQQLGDEVAITLQNCGELLSYFLIISHLMKFVKLDKTGCSDGSEECLFPCTGVVILDECKQ